MSAAVRPWATRRRTRAAWLLLALLLLAALVDAVVLQRRGHWNAVVGQVAEGGPLPAGEVPAEVRFAEAHAEAASGSVDAALRHYRPLQGDSALGQAARFNSANALLRQAVQVQAGPQPGQAIPLIELAKENYREVLRHDPQHWDARYNLERAQRLLPDAEEGTDPPQGTPSNAERAATTMRGFSPGLP